MAVIGHWAEGFATKAFFPPTLIRRRCRRLLLPWRGSIIIARPCGLLMMLGGPRPRSARGRRLFCVRSDRELQRKRLAAQSSETSSRSRGDGWRQATRGMQRGCCGKHDGRVTAAEITPWITRHFGLLRPVTDTSRPAPDYKIPLVRRDGASDSREREVDLLTQKLAPPQADLHQRSIRKVTHPP